MCLHLAQESFPQMRPVMVSSPQPLDRERDTLPLYATEATSMYVTYNLAINKNTILILRMIKRRISGTKKDVYRQKLTNKSKNTIWLKMAEIVLKDKSRVDIIND